jgi:glycerol-3-phosphate dehydrogenase
MSSETTAYDAVVAGGGIQGLTLAAEAAGRGLRVLLLESGAFGDGSTAASYGIVHGGFRYWQDLDVVRLVRSLS